MEFRFEVLAEDPGSAARAGRLTTPRGAVDTPAFMPVGTQGAVKTMAPWELEAIGVAILLANTYHLMLRPGAEVVRAAGGLHAFMGWHRPILTDSGGFQVFSLARLQVIDADGVLIRSHYDGSEHFLSPEGAIEAQLMLGSDIMMVLDECTPYPCPRDRAALAVERTGDWAARCRDRWLRARREAADLPGPGAPGLLFGIVQGSVYPDLRAASARDLVALDFPGYAVGGLSVGEPREEMARALEATVPLLPADRPRYLMGVGSPAGLVEGVLRGIDLFDCVLPTRVARHGTVLTGGGPLVVRNAAYARDLRPLEPGCPCPVCGRFTRAYVRHLLNVREVLGIRLTTWHNLVFMERFMAGLRRAVAEGRLRDFAGPVLEAYGGAGLLSQDLELPGDR